MAQPSISVVVVSYNVRPFLDHCLRSLQRASQGGDVQIIVVDNASSDRSAEMVEERYPDVLLIRNRENIGFARANNLAFEKACGDFVLILNPDSFVQEDTLSILAERLMRMPDVGAVGPKIILPDGRFEPRSMRGFPTPWAAFSYLTGLSALFPRSRTFSRYLLTYLDPESENDVGALSGCCMMVRKSILEALGGFDGDYFMYGEDLDLCYRIRKTGFRILYTPATKIVHFKGESTRRSEIDRDYHFQRAMKLFVNKHLSGNSSFFARCIVTIGFQLRDAERVILSLFRAGAAPLLDLLLLNLFIFTGRWIRFSAPDYSSAVWLVNGLYTLIYLITGLYFKAYSTKKYSGRKALYSAASAGTLCAALTYFFIQWAFSRFVVLWFAFGMAAAMPGWRILLRDWLRRRSWKRGMKWMKRKTLIVGADERACQIARQLMRDPMSELEPIGYVALTDEGIGEILQGVPILGGLEDLERIVKTEQVEELLFSSTAASYDKIISLIQKLSHHSLNFRIIPGESQNGSEELPMFRLEFSHGFKIRK